MMGFVSKLRRRRNGKSQKDKESKKLRSAAAAALKLYQAPAREVLRRLEENDPTVVGWMITADFGAGNRDNNHHNSNASIDLDELMHAMRANRTLRRLHVSGKFVARLGIMEQYQFWHVLCRAEECFPNLTSICWADFSDFATALPISVVISMLQGRPGLVEMEWSHVRFTGDIQQLGQSLKEHPSLRTIQTWDIDILGSNNTRTSQDRLLQILLDVQQLQVLSLGSFGFHHGQISAIAKSLSHPHHQLKALRLRGACSNQQPPHDNHLHQHQRPQATPLDAQSCAALADMLKVNRSLEKLELSNLQLLKQPNNQSGLVLMAQALEQSNRTLEAFHLFQFDLYCRHDMTSDENDALVAMLRTNHVLTSFLPHGCSRQAHAQIEFYLKCNQRHLWGLHVDVNLSRADLVEDVVAPLSSDKDLDCIYHVLRDNPSCIAAAASL